MRLEITRRSDLALRALRLLASTGDRLRAVDLAEHLGSTPQFVPQVMNALVKAGWVSSETGPLGGYALSGSLAQHSVLDLIELIEGPTDDGACVLRGGPCPGEEHCSLHDAWTTARATCWSPETGTRATACGKRGA